MRALAPNYSPSKWPSSCKLSRANKICKTWAWFLRQAASATAIYSIEGKFHANRFGTDAVELLLRMHKAVWIFIRGGDESVKIAADDSCIWLWRDERALYWFIFPIISRMSRAGDEAFWSELSQLQQHGKPRIRETHEKEEYTKSTLCAEGWANGPVWSGINRPIQNNPRHESTS